MSVSLVIFCSFPGLDMVIGVLSSDFMTADVTRWKSPDRLLVRYRCDNFHHPNSAIVLDVAFHSSRYPDGVVDEFEHSRLATTANLEAGFSCESELGFHACAV